MDLMTMRTTGRRASHNGATLALVPRTRAVAIIRYSVSEDPASTSTEKQEAINQDYADRENMDIVGWAVDTALSAFKIPPHKRPKVKAWLDRPDDFDCFIYWKQDRFVRDPFDFMGIIDWCREHDKKIYSATESMGDVTQDTGMLIGFIRAWQDNQESKKTSSRVKDTQTFLKKRGQWSGGRKVYGTIPVCTCHKQPKCPEGKENARGWKLMIDEKNTAPNCRELIRRVIAGESANAVAVDFGRRKIPTPQGGGKTTGPNGQWKWTGNGVRCILGNIELMTQGLCSPEEFGQLQVALNRRSQQRNVRTTGRDGELLDILFCHRCGAKTYSNRASGRGLCRNAAYRGMTITSCDLPAFWYNDVKEIVIQTFLATYGDWLIETRITSATRRKRSQEIDAELMSLSADFAARRFDRDEFTARQNALLDELDALEGEQRAEPQWKSTGVTVADHWNQISGADRRLWLLRIGMTYTLDLVPIPWNRATDRKYKYVVESGWQVAAGYTGTPEAAAKVHDLLERIVRPASAVTGTLAPPAA